MIDTSMQVDDQRLGGDAIGELSWGANTYFA